MLKFIPRTRIVSSETRLLQMNPDLSEEIKFMVEKQKESGQRARRFWTLVGVTGVIIVTWVYGPELAAKAVDRYQNQYTLLAAKRSNQKIAIWSRGMLPLVEAAENASSQYLAHAPKWQLGVSGSLKIVRSSLIVASQSYNLYQN